jgi:hypothetical protein
LKWNTYYNKAIRPEGVGYMANIPQVKAVLMHEEYLDIALSHGILEIYRLIAIINCLLT